MVRHILITCRTISKVRDGEDKDKLKLGDMVRCKTRTPEDHSDIPNRHMLNGCWFSCDIGRTTAHIKTVPEKKWLEYTILWSGLGEQLKHLGFDLIKITGAEI